MIEVDINALFKRLNAYCTRSLETAAGMCVSRGNYEVTIEHLLLAFLPDTERDFQIILYSNCGNALVSRCTDPSLCLQ